MSNLDSRSESITKRSLVRRNSQTAVFGLFPLPQAYREQVIGHVLDDRIENHEIAILSALATSKA